MEIGKKFREAREKKGLTIDDIQEKTKIRKKYLCALENENFEAIPGEVYAKAFIKSYAQQLDLNELELIQEYQEWLAQNKEIEEEEEPEEEYSLFLMFVKKYRKVITAVLVIAITIFMYNFIFLKSSEETSQEVVQNQETMSENEFKPESNQIEDEGEETILEQEHNGQEHHIEDNKTESEIDIQEEKNVNNENKLDVQQDEINLNTETESVNENSESILIVDNNESVVKDESELKNIDEDEETEVKQQEQQEQWVEEETLTRTSEKNDEENNSEQVSEQSEEQQKETVTHLKIIGSARCWIRITIDDEKVFEGFIDDGETMTFSGKEKMIMKMGNAIAVKVEKNGEILGPWGKSGEVLTKELVL